MSIATVTPVRTGVVIAAIYAALLQRSSLYGGQLISATRHRSGSVYPALEKLCRAGILEETNDDYAPTIDGRSSRRTVYRFTEDARQWAINELSRLGLPIPLEGGPVSSPDRPEQPDGESPRARRG